MPSWNLLRFSFCRKKKMQKIQIQQEHKQASHRSCSLCFCFPGCQFVSWQFLVALQKFFMKTLFTTINSCLLPQAVCLLACLLALQPCIELTIFLIETLSRKTFLLANLQPLLHCPRRSANPSPSPSSYHGRFYIKKHSGRSQGDEGSSVCISICAPFMELCTFVSLLQFSHNSLHNFCKKNRNWVWLKREHNKKGCQQFVCFPSQCDL